MSVDVLHAMDRSLAANRIAEILHDATRGASVLQWDEMAPSDREWYRARGRQAIRSSEDVPVKAAIGQIARALAQADGYTVSDLDAVPARKARYLYRAQLAWAAAQWHLAETAYPPDTEAQLAAQAAMPAGETLGAKVVETRREAWRSEFSEER